MSTHDIVCLESRVVYQNPWMTVREDQVLRPSGATGRFGVVEKPDFAVIVPVDAGHIHLVEQFRYPVGSRQWELPQGSWEGDATLPPDALAAAELREETGLVAGRMVHAGHLFLACGYSNQGYHVFFATDLTASPCARDAEEEDLVTARFPLAELDRMILAGEVKDATTVAALGLVRLRGWV